MMFTMIVVQLAHVKMSSQKNRTNLRQPAVRLVRLSVESEMISRSHSKGRDFKQSLGVIFLKSLPVIFSTRLKRISGHLFSILELGLLKRWGDCAVSECACNSLAH